MRVSISGPSTYIASLTSFTNKSWLNPGAARPDQIGNPGIKVSGKAIYRAPLDAASVMQSMAFLRVAAVSRKTGDTWHASYSV